VNEFQLSQEIPFNSLDHSSTSLISEVWISKFWLSDLPRWKSVVVSALGFQFILSNLGSQSFANYFE